MRPLRAILAAAALGLLAIATVQAQSLEEMAGQMVLVGFKGATADDGDFRGIRAQVAAGVVGGVMYLRPNISSLADVRAMNSALRAARPWMQPFITLDQEGGQIRRLTEAVGFAEIASARAIGRGTSTAAREIYEDLAQRLVRLGFNVNFGPVVDLDLNLENPIIARYERSFGSNPLRVVQMATAFVEGHRSARMGTALKHFPGHGSSTGDTHEGFVDVTNVWQPQELEPYRRLIDAGLADMIMVAHIYNANVQAGEPVQLPASLSPEWIAGVLRDELGYQGVVVSDDMEMSAVRAHFELEETIERAVMAGNDILLFSNTAAYDPALGERIHAVLVDKARENPDFARRIAESYQRIVALKTSMGLVQ